MKSIFEVKILGIVAAICAMAYLLFSYFNPEKGMDNLSPSERLSLKKNIIVLGVDERAEEHDVGRSDTLFVSCSTPKIRLHSCFRCHVIHACVSRAMAGIRLIMPMPTAGVS